MKKKELNGVTLPHHKFTENSAVQKFPSPTEVTLPMKMHIGKSAKVAVGVGDRVCIGDIVGIADGRFSSNVHATVSGVVSELREVILPDGAEVAAVKIKSDGEDRLSVRCVPPKIRTRSEFVEALFSSGIVGLGGAGFPTHVKYDIGEKRFDTLIVNCAECEPYITSDTHTARASTEYIRHTVNTVRKLYGDVRVIFACEKKSGLERWAEKAVPQMNCELGTLKKRYPQGAEKVMIYHTTGRVVHVGQLPIDVGCIVSNVSTLAEIGKYLRTGIPLVRRRVTLDGDAMLCPTVLDVPIGTKLSSVFEWCGGFKASVGKILFGGPMMGVAVYSDGITLLKNVNAVTVYSKNSAVLPAPSPCIRCASCLGNCPVNIDSAAVGRAVRVGDYVTARHLGIEACMECGCCSYVCPAKLPLTENNKNIKRELRRRLSGEG